MLSKTELNTAINRLAKSTKETRDSVQTILCNIAGHAFEHGDVTAYDLLLQATNGIDQRRIAKWMVQNGFARLSSSGKATLIKSARKATTFANGSEVVDYLLAEGPKWYADKVDTVKLAREFDLLARLKALNSQLEKAIAEKGNAKKVAEKDLAIELQKLTTLAHGIT